ncbi:hypothetical protein [Salinicola sp. DM10]|uniref:DUF4376 domain-containing protein n=1 Tax=Salinicola sp. DM10 TaxID=2815721 RepID=UPI001A90A796|nr:hypothetical protein [Salinicola sp. DM10]MCE3025724.1 hypothetical protein [Salinicola sp. DM10]
MGTFKTTPAPTAAEVAAAQAERERSAFKAGRSEKVERIQVTTSAGHTFDGDEVSQNRMARAVAGLDDGEAMPWVLADNTVIQASRAELREAMRLAGEAQAAVWVESGAR